MKVSNLFNQYSPHIDNLSGFLDTQIKSPKLNFHMKLLSLIIGIFLLFRLNAQPEDLLDESGYQFRHLTIEDGLADNIVHDVLLDRHGFVWFGTQNGLSRWDGIDFKNSFPIVGDSTAITGTLITNLEEDQKGNIWIATHQGSLCRYNPILDIFESFPYPNFGEDILIDAEMKLFLDEEEVLWIGSFADGLIKFDIHKNEFKIYRLITALDKNNDFQNNSVVDIKADIANSNILWLATNDGVIQFNKRTSEQRHFPAPKLYDHKAYGTAVACLLVDSKDHIWFGTYGSGLIKMTIKDGSWEFFHPNPQQWTKANFNFNNITGLTKKSKDEFWVSSLDEGIGIFNKKTQTFYFFDHNVNNPTSVLSEQSFHNFVDKSGRIWFTNKDKGVSFLDNNCSIFKFTPLASSEFVISNDIHLTDVLIDKINNNTYLVGMEKDGFFTYDNGKKRFYKKRLKGYNDEFLRYNKLLQRENGQVLVAGNKPWGIAKIDEIGDLIPLEHPNFKSVTNQSVYSLIEDSQGKLWGTTQDNFLFQLDLINNELKKYPLRKSNSNKVIYGYDIIEKVDASGLYLFGDQGVSFFDKQKGTIRELPNLEKIICRALLQLSSSQLLIGTTAGVIIYDLQKKRLVSTNHFKNPPNAAIDNIFYDEEHRIWLTTQKGLYHYDTLTNNFYHFGDKDGLYKNLFYEYGYDVLSNGDILLSQKSGFYRFNPDEVIATTHRKHLVFTNIFVNGKNHPLAQNEEGNKEITLHYQNNNLRISFSDLSFCGDNSSLFTYRVKGVINEWTSTFNNQNFVALTNLSPGNYVFEIKELGDSTKKTSQLKIKITPPFWRTWWAYLAYILAAFGLIRWIYLFQLKKQLAEREAQRLIELDETKSTLYTNITHEFRTPLTVIQGMTEELVPSSSRTIILRNTRHLLQMITHILDLSKLESGNMKANYIQDDIIPFLNYQTEAWSSYANTKHISLNFYTNPERLEMDFDSEKLEQIITNLLSNALKFTPEYGKIQVAVESENNMLILIIKDTGIGIPAENLSYIFDRFYQTDASTTRKGEGTGIGLALVKELVDLMDGKITVQSEVQKGTIFKVFLPIRKQAPKQHLDLKEKQSPSKNLQPKPALNIPISITEQFPRLLIIEDNQDVITYLETCLQQQYLILTAPNGKEGVQLAQKEVPDIILCDVMMPEMDGFEVCQILKEATLTSHIPIILLTAKATQIDKNEGLSYGADAYLTKPFDKQELLIRLENLIKIRRQIQLRFAQGDLLNTNVVTEISPKDRVFLNTLTQYIQDHIEQENLEIIYLQKAVNMSRAQLHKKLKALTGMNTSQYRKAVRLQEAKRILMQEDLTVAEVAYKIGYKHPSHFSRDFKELFGIAPKFSK